MQTPWEDGDTIAELDKETGQPIIHVNLGKRAHIRYWARATGPCRSRTERCPAECSSHAAGAVCPRMVGVMPATDWSPL